MKFELGADYKLNTQGAIAQMFGSKQDFGTWSGLLEMEDDDLVAIHRRGTTQISRQTVIHNVQLEVEYSVIVHFIHSGSNNGLFQVWINGEEVYSVENINFGLGNFTDDDVLDFDNHNFTTFKIGMYNYSTGEYVDNETRTIYYDNVTWYNGADGYDIVNPDVDGASCLKLPTKTEAECFDEMLGVENEGQNLGFIDNGDWVKYEGLDLSNMNSVKVNASSRNDGGTIEVRLGNPEGDLIGSVDVGNTGNWGNYKQEQANISRVTGEQDVYLVFVGGSNSLFNLDWFGFSEDHICEASTTSQIEAECFDEMEGIQTQNCSEGTLNIGFTDDGDWIRYNGIDLTDMNAFNVRVASQKSGKIEVRLDGVDGELLVETDVIETGGWQKWRTDATVFNRVDGIHDVYLVFTGGINVNSFGFSQETVTSFDSGVEIYPNPANEHLIINSEKTIQKVMITNIVGDVFVEEAGSNNDMTLNTSELSSGVYLLRITLEDGNSIVRKITRN